MIKLTIPITKSNYSFENSLQKLQKDSHEGQSALELCSQLVANAMKSALHLDKF